MNIFSGVLLGHDCSFTLHFWGAESLEPIGLPRFWRVTNSFVAVFEVRPSGTIIRAGAFIASICNFVTLAASLNESGN